MQQIPLQHIMQQITLKIYAARGGHYRLCKQRASSVGVAQQAKCGLHSAANNIQQIAATLQLHKEPHNAVPRSFMTSVAKHVGSTAADWHSTLGYSIS
jgi:hypothetical protein